MMHVCVYLYFSPTVLISTGSCQLMMPRTRISTNELVYFLEIACFVCVLVDSGSFIFGFCAFTCRPSVTSDLVNCFKNTPVKPGSLSCKLICSKSRCVQYKSFQQSKYPHLPPSTKLITITRINNYFDVVNGHLCYSYCS